MAATTIAKTLLPIGEQYYDGTARVKADQVDRRRAGDGSRLAKRLPLLPSAPA